MSAETLRTGFEWVFHGAGGLTVLICLILLAQRLFASYLSPRGRYALWFLLLVRIAAPGLPDSPFSVYHLVPDWTGGVGSDLRLDTSASRSLPLANPITSSNLPENERSASTPPISPPQLLEAATIPSPSIASVSPDGLGEGTGFLFPIVWLTGVVSVLLFTFGRLVVSFLDWRRFPAVEEDGVLKALEESRFTMGVEREVRVVRSPSRFGPALCGIFKPKLVIPEGIEATLGMAGVRLVLLHELAHFKRKDVLVNCLAKSLFAIHWFNPLVWYAAYRMRLDQEMACDSYVLSCSPPEHRQEYAETLLRLLERNVYPGRLVEAVGLGQGAKNVKERLQAISGYRSFRRSSPAVFTALLASLSLLTLTEAKAPSPDYFPEGLASGSNQEGSVETTGTRRQKIDRISGRVVDGEGKPLQGVRVDVFTWCSGNETTTDSEGAYVLEGIEGGESIEVMFRKRGFSPRHFYAWGSPTFDRPLVLDNTTYFEGTVRRADGGPAGDVLIRALLEPKLVGGMRISGVSMETRSDGSGQYRLYVDQGRYEFTLLGQDGSSSTVKDVDIRVGEAKRSDFELAPGSVFRATVVDSETGAPVPGVRFWNRRVRDFEGTSDSEGRVEIVGMPPGDFTFEVQADGYGRWWSDQCSNSSGRPPVDKDGSDRKWQRNFDRLTFDIGESADTVLVYVEPSVRVRGVVLDPEGNRVAGATVSPALSGTGNSITGDGRYSFKTDESGEFEMELPASKRHRYNLVAHDGDFGEWRTWANGVLTPLSTQPGDLLEGVTLTLNSPNSVSGRVVDRQGRPASGVAVRAQAQDKLGNRYYDPAVETDEDGRFTLEHVRPGLHFVQVEPFRRRAEEAEKGTSRLIDIAPGQPVEAILLVAAEQ